MAKSLKETLTSIADKIRAATTADSDATPITDKMTLEYIDDYALDFSYQVMETAGYWDGWNGGYEDGENNGIGIGYEMGYNEGEQNGVAYNEGMVASALNSPVQKVESYSGFHCDFVDSMGQIQYLDENIPNVYDKGVADGRQAEYDSFWDAYQDNGSRADYDGAFYGGGWNTDTFKPKHDIKPTFASNIFRRCGFSGDMEKLFEDLKITLDTSACTTFDYGCYQALCETFPEFDLSSANSATSIFGYCKAKKISIVSKESLSYTNTFTGCLWLTELIIKGVVGGDLNLANSPLLKKSISDVISALSETTSGKTITFSKAVVNTAFGINVDDTTTYPEGSEFYILRHSKDNWSFNYV